MRTISPPPLFGRLVHLDMLDDQVTCVEPLCITIRLCVLEQIEQERT